MDAEVVAEPDDGGAAEGGGVGGVGGAERVERERALERGCGNCGFEERFCRGERCGEGEAGERGDLGRDFDFVGVGSDFGRVDEVGRENCG